MKKFKDAYKGLILAFKHKAVKVQALLGLLAVIAGIVLKLDYYEWLIFVVLIGSVITMEIVNTCIEYLCNFISPEYNEKIKNIKDISAGFVLCVSLMALIIAIIVFVRRIL